jgi:isocitrate dehydrogenase kinase/phosphatase
MRHKLAEQTANIIRRAFDTYKTRFKDITLRAKVRFKNRDWHGMQADSAERLDLYKKVVDETVGEVRQLLGPQLEDTRVWATAKVNYAGLVAGLDLWELGETFFNSVTRRVFRHGWR